MDFKKLGVLLTLALLTIILIGYVSALNIDYSGGADPERGISIENIEFNIPNGYIKNDSKTVVNQTNSSENITYVLNQETFENADGKEIVISIVDYDDFDVDEDTLYRICEGAENKTLMGYPGYMSGNDTSVQFAYAFDHRAVSITAPSEELINQMLVVEDA